MEVAVNGKDNAALVTFVILVIAYLIVTVKGVLQSGGR